MLACRDKLSHPTFADADQHARTILRNGLDTDPSRPLRPYQCPRCLRWHIGHGADAHGSRLRVLNLGGQMTIDQTKLEQEVAAVFARDPKSTVLVVGGPAGFFDIKLERHARVVHHPSVESKATDAAWTLPAHAGIVLLTKFVSRDLGREVVGACHRAAVPVFGVFNSPGAVNRALKFLTTAPPAATLAEVFAREDRPADDPPPGLPASAPTVTASVAEIEKAFEEIETMLALAKDVAVAAVRDAAEARRSVNQAQAETAVLRQLRALLREPSEA